MDPKNIIELNGKHYDATTGKLITNNKSHQPVKPATVQAQPPEKQAAKPSKSVNSPTKHKRDKKPDTFKEAKSTAPRTAAPHATAHQPEHATTLMRQAVKKPSTSLKRKVKVTTPTAVLAETPLVELTPKHSAEIVDDHRLKRAKHVTKSGLVSRFSPSLTKPAPKAFKPSPPKPPALGTRIQVNRTPTVVPSVSTPPSPKSSPPSPQQMPPARPQPSMEILERAIAHANSHKQPPPRIKAKKRRRIRQAVSLITSSLAIIFILSFIAYQNIANLQMHLASTRAGVSATLPNWQPSGFTPHKFTYHPGTVMVQFQNNNAQSFNLIQTSSTWDNSALLNEYVAPHYDSYQIIQSNGNVIYTYENNNATWVRNGVWYQLNTDGVLSTSQLIHLATST